MREKGLQLLLDIFKEYEQAYTISKEIEQAIYNQTKEQISKQTSKDLVLEKSNLFKNKYKRYLFKIISNLRLNNNKELVWNMIEAGEISPEEILTMQPQKLDPERWEKEKLKITKNITFTQPKLEMMNDGLHKCYKCKSIKTTYYQLQTRSSDEPMTNFITCHNCDNKWKY